jgi:hypothetical protein
VRSFLVKDGDARQIGFDCGEATQCGVRTDKREDWRLCTHPEAGVQFQQLRLP